jgi:hypothetical protein
MANDPTLAGSIVPALIGFTGVFIGLAVGIIKDFLTNRAKRNKDVEYLAIKVTTALDQYVDGCSSVAADDGTHYGSPDEDGYYRPQIEAPELNLHDLEVEWKSLPGYLLYEVLDFPNKIADVKHYLSNASEYSDPPYDEYMHERQYEYAKLGINANTLSSKLRMLAGFPTKEPLRWDAIGYMQEQIDKFERQKEQKRYVNPLD